MWVLTQAGPYLAPTASLAASVHGLPIHVPIERGKRPVVLSTHMESGRVRAGVVLVLAVAALGAAGATLDAGSTGGGTPGAGEGSGVGVGQGETGILAEFDPPPGGDGGGGWIARLLAAAMLGGVAVAVAYLVQAIRTWGLADLLAFLRTNAGRVLAAGAVIVALFLFVRYVPALPTGGGSTGVFGSAEAPGSGAVGEVTGEDLPVGVLAVGAALVVLVVALAVRSIRRGGDATPETAAPSSGAPAGDGPAGPDRAPGGVGPADPPPADNEVYRTWLALADAAGVDPRRRSPASVAERAVDAGVDEPTAREATALFEAVRYGRAPASDRRERRARRLRQSLAGGGS